MKAFDVMTWGAISVRADEPVLRAAQLMLEHRLSGLPVLNLQGNLVGIVTKPIFSVAVQEPIWPGGASRGS